MISIINYILHIKHLYVYFLVLMFYEGSLFLSLSLSLSLYIYIYIYIYKATIS